MTLWDFSTGRQTVYIPFLSHSLVEQLIDMWTEVKYKQFHFLSFFFFTTPSDFKLNFLAYYKTSGHLPTTDVMQSDKRVQITLIHFQVIFPLNEDLLDWCATVFFFFFLLNFFILWLMWFLLYCMSNENFSSYILPNWMCSS